MNIINIKNLLLLITILSTALLTQSATAGNRSHRINKIQTNQSNRILQGIKSGSLTHDEARILHKQQENIEDKECLFKADGRFTRREASILRNDLKRLSKKIYKLKHNNKFRQWKRAKRNTHHWKLSKTRCAVSGSINQRKYKQKQRIKQGLLSGSLTIREAAELGLQHSRIEEQECNFKADGRFTRHERKIIKKRLKNASRNIYKKKHNCSFNCR